MILGVIFKDLINCFLAIGEGDLRILSYLLLKDIFLGDFYFLLMFYLVI